MNTLNTKRLLLGSIGAISTLSPALAAPLIGLQLYTLRNSGTLEEQLSLAQSAGIHNLEIVGTEGVTAGEMNTLLAQHDMKVVSSHTDFSDLTGNLQSVIDYNKSIGNSVITLPYLAPAIRPTDAAGWAALGTQLKSIGDQLHDQGMSLVYHNHWFEFTSYGDKLALEIMLEAAGPNVRSELDLGWIPRAGLDPVEVLKRLRGRIYAVHAKDVTSDPTTLDDYGFTHLPEWGFATIGTGVIDWQKVMPAVYASGAEIYLIEGDSPIDAAATITNGFQYLEDNISLRPDFTLAAQTPNQRAVAGVVNGMDPLSELYGAVYLAQSTSNALDQFSGSIYPSTSGALVEESQLFRDAINARLHNRMGSHLNRPDSSPGKSEQGDGGAKAPDGLSFWSEGIGGKTSYYGSSAGDFDGSLGGILAGADAKIGSSWVLGFTGGYSRSSFDNFNSEASSDNYLAGIYAGTKANSLSFRSAVAYSRHDVNADRHIGISQLFVDPYADQLSANYNGDMLQGFGELGYELDTGKITFEPYVGVADVWLSPDGFKENGGASALSVNGMSLNTTFTSVGLRASTDFPLGNMYASLHGGIAWRHAFGDVTPTSQHSFDSGSSFEISGVPIAKDVATLETGIDLELTPNATLDVSYNGQFSSGQTSNAVHVGLNISF